MSNDKSININDYLDKDVSELPDMKGRELMPNGRHVVQVLNVEQKELGGKLAMVFTYSYLGCEELANPSDTQPKEGTEFQETFFLTTENGLGALKKHIAPIAPAGVKLGEALMGIVGSQYRITTTQRGWKDKTSGEERMGWNTKDGLQPLSA
jgi:hypothetical protein